jgi:hypothetical protein
MALARNATAACARLESGDPTIGPPEPGRAGRADSLVDRRLPGPFQAEKIADAAIMDKSGNTPPNIGHFP